MSALSNGIKIVEAVAAAGKNGLSFARIVQATAIPKSTAHRLLRELVDLSLLTLDPATRYYRGGLKIARIGAAVAADYDLRTVARPSLQALHAETGHVATLGVMNDAVGIYVDKIEPNDFRIRLHSEIGKQFPLHCTAMGKVLLAATDSKTRRRLTERKLESFTPNTITDGATLRKELDRIAVDGYAIDREEITRGLVCVAAPVFGVDGRVAGAMSSTFPSYLLDERDIELEIEAVTRNARRASA